MKKRNKKYKIEEKGRGEELVQRNAEIYIQNTGAPKRVWPLRLWL